MPKTYVLIALHDRPDLVDSCAILLNQEWKRSHGLRTRSLLKSNGEFPLNLAMLERTEGGETVVGHVRLTRVVGKSKSLYLSSVIIEQNLRGMGLGRKILELTEDYIKQDFNTLYLRTKSTPFYVKCGYEDCDPVQEYTSSVMEDKINQLQEKLHGKPDGCGKGCGSSATKSTDSQPSHAANKSPSKCDQMTAQTPDLPPPPPIPPPVSCFPNSAWENDHDCECNFWMRKVIPV